MQTPRKILRNSTTSGLNLGHSIVVHFIGDVGAKGNKPHVTGTECWGVFTLSHISVEKALSNSEPQASKCSDNVLKNQNRIKILNKGIVVLKSIYGYPGFEGCVSTKTDHRKVNKIPQVCGEGPKRNPLFPVQSAPFQPVISSVYIYQGPVRGSSSPKVKQNTNDLLLGQPIDLCRLVYRAKAKSGWVAYQLGEVSALAGTKG